MKVKNMKSKNGNTVPNQFIINDDLGNRFFQSYNSIIVKQDSEGQIWLDRETWGLLSVTTVKYRKEFLNEGVEVTRAKIQNGEYKLTNLNN